MKVWIAENNTPIEAIELNDAPLASGGEGSLYRLVRPDDPSVVAKIYHNNRRTPLRRDKMGYLQEHPPKDFAPEEGITLVWPKEVLTDEAGAFMGFLMPFATGEKLEILCLPQLPKRHQTAWEAYDRAIPGQQQRRLGLCYNIARAIERLHQTERYVVIDMKPDNILVQPDGSVALVDLDSIEVVENGETLYDAPVATPEYTPPDSYWEQPEVDPTQEEPWDRFGLAVIFYKLLLGVHPFAASTQGDYAQYTSLYQKIEQGLFVHHPNMQAHFSVVPPLHDRYHRLPIRVQQLFERAFIAGHEQPFMRPSASEWVQVLYEFRPTSQLDETRLAIPDFSLRQWSPRLKLDQLLELPSFTPLTPTTKLQADQPLDPKAVAQHSLPEEIQDPQQIRSQRFFNFVVFLLLLVIGAALSLTMPWYGAVLLGVLGYLGFNYSTFKSRKSAERKSALQGVVDQQYNAFQNLLDKAAVYETQLQTGIEQLQNLVQGEAKADLESVLAGRHLLQAHLDTFATTLDQQKAILQQYRKAERQAILQLQQQYLQWAKERCPMANPEFPTLRQQLQWLQRQRRLGHLSQDQLAQYDASVETLEQLQLQYQIELEGIQHEYQERAANLLFRCQEQHRQVLEAVQRYQEEISPKQAETFQQRLKQQQQILSQIEQWQYDLQGLEQPLQRQVAAYRDAKETAARYAQINFGRHLLEMVGLKKPL